MAKEAKAGIKINYQRNPAGGFLIHQWVFPGMVKGVQEGNWQEARYSPYGYKYNKVNKLLEIDEADSR